MLKTVFLSNCLFFAHLFAQDFSYQSLRSKGDIPKDFTTYTIEKIDSRSHNHNEEFLKLSKKEQKLFLEIVHQGIDDILRSGQVLFGDTVSNYINELGEIIVGGDTSLRNIRFYTLKTNVVNAFSTNQGIIFVSQGLIAQVKNEAQLAFVLAHELAHYIERHVIVGFTENLELMNSGKSMTEKIKRYSLYSKDKEYEADRIGVELYHKMGYNLADLQSVFDLLSFSYLPFGSKKVEANYFNVNNMFLPKSFFKEILPEVKPDDEDDDSQSTHPNIKSRRDQLSGEIKKYSNWDQYVTRTSEEKFLHARKTARLEVLRNDLYSCDYNSALYNAFLLEDEFKEDLVFNQYRAQAWLGLLIFKAYSRFLDIAYSLDRLQGEQHQMHHVMRSLNRKQLSVLALRNIYDISQKFPDDELIQEIYLRAIRSIVKDDKFRVSEFYTKSFLEVMENYGPEIKLDSNGLTSSGLSATMLAIERSKYGMSAKGEIKDEDFYKYGIPDIISDTAFVNLFEKERRSWKAELEKEEERKKNFREVSKREKKLLEKNSWIEEDTSSRKTREEMKMGIDNLILFEPRVYPVKNGNFDIIEAERLEIKIKNAFEHLEVDFMTVHKIGAKELKNQGVAVYNEGAVLMNVLNQVTNFEDLELFPVDYYEIQEIRRKYNSDKVAFIVLHADRQPWRTKLATVALASSVPFLSFLINKKSHRYVYSIFLFDLKTNQLEGAISYNMHGTPSSAALETLSYDFLNVLKEKPKND